MSLAPPLPPAEPPSEPRQVPFHFTGSGAEYFRIWIVNLALTALTLGIYSAWAKVRTRRYFYANLRLEGSGFEYTADPLRILIGRLVVVALFIVYSLLGSFNQTAGLAFAGVILAATPFLVVRSLAFHRRNSRYRGLRFKFLGSYAQAAGVYLGWPVLSVLSLGLAVPYAHAKRHAFVAGNTAYGTSRFGFDWREVDYYALYAKAIATVLGVALVAGMAAVATGALAGLGEASEETTAAEGALSLIMLAVLAIYVLAYALAYALFQAGATNLLYGGLHVAEVRVRSTLPALALLREYAICAAAIALSFGLALPWAQVRLARFRAGHISLLVTGSLDDFGQSEEEAHSLGEFADEAAVAFDIDFGL